MTKGSSSSSSEHPGAPAPKAAPPPGSDALEKKKTNVKASAKARVVPKAPKKSKMMTGNELLESRGIYWCGKVSVKEAEQIIARCRMLAGW
jgi:hypothetical protein